MVTQRTRTDDGVELELRWDLPEGPVRAVVVGLHPHPRYGGDLNHPVLAAMAARLPRVGVGVVRVSFRGAGRSGGTCTDGAAEPLDVVATIRAAAELGAPVVVVGYSFGADVSLACLADPAVTGWVLVAPTCSIVPRDRWQDPAAPVLIIRPRHDQYAPAEEPSWRGGAPVDVDDLEGADHFLVGRAGPVVDRVARFVDDVVAPGSTRPASRSGSAPTSDIPDENAAD